MKLPERLTMREARSVGQALADHVRAAARDGVVEVDAGALRELDSSALAVLLEAGRSARRVGAVLRVTQAPTMLSRLAALYGVTELLGLPAGPVAQASPA